MKYFEMVVMKYSVLLKIVIDVRVLLMRTWLLNVLEWRMCMIDRSLRNVPVYRDYLDYETTSYQLFGWYFM